MPLSRIASESPYAYTPQEPFIQLPPVFLRITTLVLGILLVCAGVLTAIGPPYLTQVGRLVGWSLSAAGVALMFAALLVKCVKQHLPTIWQPEDDQEVAASLSDSPGPSLTFDDLPPELQFKTLDLLDEKSLTSVSLTNQKYGETLNHEFRKKILKFRFRELAFKSWQKAVIKGENLAFALWCHQELKEGGYVEESIHSLKEALARMEKERSSEDLTEKLRFLLHSISLTPHPHSLETSQLVQRAVQLLSRVEEDGTICLCAEALSSIDHTRSLDLVNKIKNSYLKNKTLAEIVRGLALTKYEEHKDLIYQIIHEMHTEGDKVCALVWTIRVAPQLDSRSEPLARALKMADTFTDHDEKNKTLYALGQRYSVLHCFKEAFEILERVAEDTSKGRLIALIAQESKDPIDLEKLLIQARRLTQNRYTPLLSVAQAFAGIDPTRAEHILHEITTQTVESEAREEILHAIGKTYALLNCEKIEGIASEISDARLKIDLLVTQARYSTSRDRVAQLFKEAIALVPQLGEGQKIGPLCDIAQGYALIDAEEAEALLELAVRELEAVGGDSRMMLFIASAYALLDYHKARSLVETTYANSFSWQTNAYLAIAHTLY